MDSKTLTDIATLVLATAAISQTTARSKVFAPVRKRAAAFHPWLGDLAECPYCTSHWVALVLVLLYRTTLTTLFLPVDLLVTTFAIVALTSFVGAGIALVTFHPEQKAREKSAYDAEEPKETERVI